MRNPQTLFCSFCEKEEEQAFKLIKGPEQNGEPVLICEKCVSDAGELVHSEEPTREPGFQCSACWHKYPDLYWLDMENVISGAKICHECVKKAAKAIERPGRRKKEDNVIYVKFS